MVRLIASVKSFMGRKEEGATMIEYALMLSLIAVVCIAAVTLVGTNLKTMFESIAAAV